MACRRRHAGRARGRRILITSRQARLAALSVLWSALGCSTVLGIDGDFGDVSSSTDAGSGGLSGGDAGGSSPEGGSSAGSAGTTAAGASAGGAPSSSCAGVRLSGRCWYLSALGQSCSNACVPHGGNAADAASFVGVTGQGGSLAECAALLNGLGISTAPTQATRLDGVGLGCHVYGVKTYWLSAPTYSATSKHSSAQLVCGCLE